jgi:hypothetical protein
LTVEALESRYLPSNYTLGPLVQLSSTSLFADCYTPQPGDLINAEDENQLAVDPTNPKHMVGLWHQDETNQGILGQVGGVTFDGGTTWRLAPLPGVSKCSGGTLPGVSDPWVAFAPNGDLYATSMAVDFPGDDEFSGVARSQILISKSTDGGLTWSTPTILADDAKHSVLNDKETVTIDPADSNLVYVVWHKVDAPEGVDVRKSSPLFGLTGANVTTAFTRSTDGGRTWEPIQTLYNPGANSLAAVNQIVVRPDGTLVDLLTETLINKNNDGGYKFDNNLSLLLSSDKGQTWLPKGKPIRTNKMQTTSVTDPETGDFVYTHSPFNDISDVAVDPHSGVLYAVWEDSRFSDGQYASIAFSQSLDGGLTWSTPIAINKTPTNIPAGDRQAFVPSIAVAADGTVGVTYYDFRNNDAKPGLATDYWVVIGKPTTPTGLTNPANWGGELRLSNRSFDLQKTLSFGSEFVGHYEGFSAAGNDFVATFSQVVSDADPQSIFFRRIIAGSPLEAASLGHNRASATLTSQQTDALVPPSVHPWQAALANTVALAGIDLPSAALGGTTLGPAAGPSEFPTTGNQSRQQRRDLPAVPEHERGQVLGPGQADAVIAGTLVLGPRQVPPANSTGDDPDQLDRLPATGQTLSELQPFSESLPVLGSLPRQRKVGRKA